MTRRTGLAISAIRLAERVKVTRAVLEHDPSRAPHCPLRETQGRREIVRSAISVKSWLLDLPAVAAVRPACCPACKAASTPIGGRIVVQGHGKRPRQGWGPTAPRAPPEILALMVRRYRCIACGALTTVGPSETLTKRLYTASAIAWALALYGLLLLTPTAVRELVSPLRIWGTTSGVRWQTLLRWAGAAAGGRLFPTVREMPDEWPARTVATRVAALLSACTLPSPEPPPLDVQAFHGAALAR